MKKIFAIFFIFIILNIIIIFSCGKKDESTQPAVVITATFTNTLTDAEKTATAQAWTSTPINTPTMTSTSTTTFTSTLTPTPLFQDDAETGISPTNQYPNYWIEYSGGTFSSGAIYSIDYYASGLKSIGLKADNNANEKQLQLKLDGLNGTTGRKDITIKFNFYWDPNQQSSRYIGFGLSDNNGGTDIATSTNRFGCRIYPGNTNIVNWHSGNSTVTFSQAMGSSGWKTIYLRVNNLGQVKFEFDGIAVVDFSTNSLINSNGPKLFFLHLEGGNDNRVAYFDDIKFDFGITWN